MIGLVHSIKCFNEWGALAVAKWVESSLQSRFGSNIMINIKEADMVQRIPSGGYKQA